MPKDRPPPRPLRRPLDPSRGRLPSTYNQERLHPTEPPVPPDLVVPHPRRRGECRSGPRPCPLVGCLHNNYLDVRQNGDIRLSHPGRLPEDVPPEDSCSLDVAEYGPNTLDRVASVLGLTRERIRQIEKKLVAKIKLETMEKSEDNAT